MRIRDRAVYEQWELSALPPATWRSDRLVILRPRREGRRATSGRGLCLPWLSCGFDPTRIGCESPASDATTVGVRFGGGPHDRPGHGRAAHGRRAAVAAARGAGVRRPRCGLPVGVDAADGR